MYSIRQADEADRWRAALDAVAAEVLHAAAIAGPPVDALQVAAAIGLRVAEDDRQAARARFVRPAQDRGRGVILLAREPRAERRQWAVAHEIGESTVWRVFEWLGDPGDGTPSLREQVANQLANRLLLPTEWFGPDGEACGWDLMELKRRYATASHELVGRRMLDFATAVIISVVDERRTTFRRSNAIGRPPPMAAAELTAWQAAHQQNRPTHEQAGGLSVRAWPIHEPQWRREIVRTELMDVDAA